MDGGDDDDALTSLNQLMVMMLNASMGSSVVVMVEVKVGESSTSIWIGIWIMSYDDADDDDITDDDTDDSDNSSHELMIPVRTLDEENYHLYQHHHHHRCCPPPPLSSA